MQVLTRRHQLYLKEKLEEEVKDKQAVKAKAKAKAKASIIKPEGEPKPKAKAKAKSQAKAAAKANAKAGAKAGAKAKAKARGKAKAGPDANLEEELHEVVSSEKWGGEELKENPIEPVLIADEVCDGEGSIASTMGSTRKELFPEDGVALEDPGSKDVAKMTAAKAKAKAAAAKRRAAAKAKAKAAASSGSARDDDGEPAAKAPKRRRLAKCQDADELDMENAKIQDDIRSEFPKVSGMEFDDLKSYLVDSEESKFNKASIMAYWTRGAVGVKWHIIAGSSQVAYFAYKDTTKTSGSWTRRMVAAYISGRIFVASKKIINILGCFL